jgi:hypothetical protein
VIPVATPLSGYTGSQQAMRTIYKWLEQCVKSHKIMCPQLVTPDGPPKLPHRVLDVTISDENSVRLVETQGKVGYWACLSHCWGEKQPLKTTRDPDTLSQHQIAIPWDTLPKTFQDAIFVTRALGIQYLWIDSLCIIQDDSVDWQFQSAQMADIYRNSILTIAGSASSGHSQGIFRTADPSHVDSPVSDLVGSTKLDHIRGRKALVHDAARLPLLQRGWVHQERLLSPRFLHFGEHEMIWECMEHLTCECGGLNLSDSSRLKWLAPKDRFHPYSLQLVNWGKHRGPPVWHAVVSDYSHMALTKSTDIFPAISGLAKSIIETTGWEYVAGLWKENIIVDMVWTTQQPRLVSRCVPWRAPTFSWASVISRTHEGLRGSVNFQYMDILRQGLEVRVDKRRETYFYATLVETVCTPIKDSTGQLEYAHVVMKGTLIKSALSCTSSSGTWRITAVDKGPYTPNIFSPDFDFDSNTVQTLTSGDEVYCLRLIGTKKHVEFYDEEFLVYLVLRRVHVVATETASSGSFENAIFERIGLLANCRGEIQLEDESEEGAIFREVMVKIV